MNIKKHRNGTVSLILDKDERSLLWGIVRQGRKNSPSLAKPGEYRASYDVSAFALDLMRLIDSSSVNYAIQREFKD